MNANWTALCKHTNNYRRLLHILYCIQNHNIKHIWPQKQNLSTRLYSGFVLVFAFRATCFRLNHQLPCFALEYLVVPSGEGVFFFFGSQVNVFVSFSLRPKLIPLSVNQWNRQHAFGLRWCSCTSLLRSKLAFPGSIRTAPSPPDRHKDTWAL